MLPGEQEDRRGPLILEADKKQKDFRLERDPFRVPFCIKFNIIGLGSIMSIPIILIIQNQCLINIIYTFHNFNGFIPKQN